MVARIVEDIILLILGWMLRDILPKIVKAIKQRVQKHRKNPKMEIDADFTSPFPIIKTSKGYIVYRDNPKALYCGNCYTVPSEMIRLEKTGYKKYTCPACKKEYKG